MDKADLRKQLKIQRQQFSIDSQHSCAQNLLEHFIHYTNSLSFTTVGVYFPIANEANCQIITQYLWQIGKACYLPVCNIQSKQLSFAKYTSITACHANQYGIMEPTQLDHIAVENLDIVLVPLLGFDLQGYRLGTGAGYYDQTFAFLNKDTTTKPLLIGLAYEFQKLPALPHDPWDIPLNAVITEKQAYSFR